MRTLAEAVAPGRVCLAGEDIDWISGPAILCAIEMHVKATATHTPTDTTPALSVTSSTPFNVTLDVPLTRLGTYYHQHPLDYSHAAAKVLADQGIKLEPMKLAITSDLPAKAGLSSSAAVTLASLGAIAALHEFPIDEEMLSHLAYAVESDELHTGAGQMDMYACGLGGLIYLDSSTTPPADVETFQLPTGYDIVIVDTLTPRNTRDVIAGKRERFNRQEPLFMKYVHETEVAIALLKTLLEAPSLDMEAVGGLVAACHYFLREYMQVSTPLIEECVATALKKGALTAKLTGTGMGGCVFALVPEDNTAAVVSALKEKPVKVFVTRPSSTGVQIISQEKYE